MARNISAPSRPNRDSRQGTGFARRSAQRSAGSSEAVTDFKQVVEPFVQQHVEPPAAIQLGVAALGELPKLDVAMSLAAADGFHEPRIVIDAYDEVRIRRGAARVVEPVGK